MMHAMFNDALDGMTSHPSIRPEKRFTDRIETVAVDSVFAWLNRTGLGAPVITVR